MSSPAFRAIVKAQMTAHWSPRVWFDLSDYTNVSDLPATGETPVVLVQFVGGPERFATIATAGTHGWEEIGTFHLHLLMPTGEDSSRALAWGEELRAIFRGKRFGSYVVESLDPFTDALGAAIRILGKWHGWSSAGSYYNVICNGP